MKILQLINKSWPRAVFLIFLLCLTAAAAVPNRIVYQGRLSKGSGSTAGPHIFVATLVSGAGAALWSSGPLTKILPASGDFTLVLEPSGVDWVKDAPKLQIAVDGTVLSPHEDFAASPYALVASSAMALAEGASVPPSRIQLSSTATLADWRSPSNPSKINPNAFEGAPQITPNSVDTIAIKDETIRRNDLDLPAFDSAGAGLVPSGAIILWTKTNQCPAGYTRINFMDGKFPRSAAAPGTSGGAENHAHPVSVPDHTHGMGHVHSTGGANLSDEQTINTLQGWTYFNTPKLIRGVAAESSGDWVFLQGYDHSHDTGNPSTGDTGKGGAWAGNTGSTSSLPPFFDCLFCMKD